MTNPIGTEDQTTNPPIVPETAPEVSAESDAKAAQQRQDAEIVAAVLAGDTDRFAELVERYKGAVYNLCFRMLNNAAEAEDASQEVFVRAYTQLRTYQPTHRFSTWILAIANHYAIDLLRRRRAKLVDIETVAFQEKSDDPEPEEQAITAETGVEVRNLLNKLPEKYRNVTILRYWEDMSYDEIAEATGLALPTVKTRLFRARELLARELAAQRAGNNNASTATPNNAKPARRTPARKRPRVNSQAMA